MTWPSGLPRATTMAERPCFVTDRKWCGWLAALMASMAICVLPSVPFLKPTGIERPDESWRCTWLSVVRAPMAPHETRSAMYCGVIVSRNSHPAGRPFSARSSSRPRASSRPSLTLNVLSRCGSLMSPFHPTVVRWLLEVDAHDEHQRVLELGADGQQLARVLARRLDVVDRARPHDDDQAIVLAAQHLGDGGARVGDGRRGGLRQRQVLHEDRGRDERPDALDPEVVGGVEHGSRRI